MKLSKNVKFILLIVMTLVMFLSMASDCNRTDNTGGTYNLTIGVTGEGSVNPGEGTHRIARGTTVELTVNASEGWEFDNWTGSNANDVIKDGDIYKINMNSNKSITARFINGDSIDVTDFLVLTKGGHVTGVDGVSIGDPANILTKDINLLLEKTDDPSSDVPFPSFIDNSNIVSDFYELSAEEFFTTENSDDYLIMGIPVPEGIDPSNLGFAVLTPPGWVISLEPMDSAINWEFLEGDYEEDTGVFWTLLSTISTTDSPQVISLVQAEWLSLPEVKSLSGKYGSDNFRVIRRGLSEDQSPPSHKEITFTQLEIALEAFVNNGFVPPIFSLRTTTQSINSGWYLITNRFEYRHRYGSSPNGYYNGFWRTAGTIYPGAPSEPNPITATHELFHAIQYSYNSFYWQTVGRIMPGGTIEGTATAIEQSLNGLSRSDRENMSSRSPMLISTSLLDNIPYIIQSALTSDYQTQDFWVYIGKKMNPNNPKIGFLVDLIKTGGSKKSIDIWLASNHNFSGLSDAYWQWAKDYSFEKTIKLGTHEGRTVPYDAPGEWWNLGLGNRGDNTGRFSPNTGDFTGEPVNFNLEPLSSRAFVIELVTGTNFYEVTLDVDTGNNNKIKYKFYDGTNENWIEDRDNTARTFIVESNRVEIYVLVSNTALTSNSGNLRVTANMIEYVPYKVSGRITDYTGGGVEGVNINFSGDLDFQSVYTDSNGNWSQELYGEITITPEFGNPLDIYDDYEFIPESIIVNQAKNNVNFFAKHWYNLSGKLTEGTGRYGRFGTVYFFREGENEHFEDIVIDNTGLWSNRIYGMGEIIISPLKHNEENTEGWIPKSIIVNNSARNLRFRDGNLRNLDDIDNFNPNNYKRPIGLVVCPQGKLIEKFEITFEIWDRYERMISDIDILYADEFYTIDKDLEEGSFGYIYAEHLNYNFEPEFHSFEIEEIEPGDNFFNFIGHPK